MKKKIGLWIYQNDGGDKATKIIVNQLQKKSYEVISNFDMRNCYIYCGQVYTEDGINLSDLSVLYHMNIDQQNSYQNDILRLLELTGVKVINAFEPFANARDKLTTNLILNKNGISVPEACFINNNLIKSKNFEQIFHLWGTVILKKRRGAGGSGIIKLNSWDDFLDLYDYLDRYAGEYYFEQFIPFKGHDYRVEIFNNKVISSYGRIKKHSYKTNAHYGGIHSNIPCNEDIINLALKATKALDITTTIVDIVRSNKDNQLYVLEVNEIMGIFLEHNPRAPKNLHKNLCTDNVKINAIVQYITDITKT